MPVTTNFATFISRANQTPLTTQRPRTPSPTHTRLNRIVDVGLEDRVDWRKQQGLVRQNAVKCLTDEEWIDNTPDRVKLTREKIKEECLKLGLKANKHNINDVTSRGKYAPWSGPWLRLDEDKVNDKMWLSTFSGGSAHRKKHSEETLEEYAERVLPLTRGWIIKQGIKGSDNDEFPSRSIDITFCPPDVFIRIIRQFMPVKK